MEWPWQANLCLKEVLVYFYRILKVFHLPNLLVDDMCVSLSMIAWVTFGMTGWVACDARQHLNVVGSEHANLSSYVHD